MSNQLTISPAKVTVSAVMYSGWRDPKMEISKETSVEILEMLAKCNDRSLKVVPSKLGPNGYMVSWDTEGFPGVLLHVSEGIIALYCYSTASYLKDTAGLEDYLADLMRPLIEKHNEEMLRVSQQEKV